MNRYAAAQIRYATAWTRLLDLADEIPDWDAATPCTGWTARHLAGHLAAGADQVRAMLADPCDDTAACDDAASCDDAAAPPLVALTDPDALAHRAGPHPAATLRAAGAALLAALDDAPAAVATPHGDLPLAQVLDMALIEPVVHGHDLSRAAQRPRPLEPDTVAVLLSGVETLGDRLAATGMYAPARPGADAADPAERLLLLLGRSPAVRP